MIRASSRFSCVTEPSPQFPKFWWGLPSRKGFRDFRSYVLCFGRGVARGVATNKQSIWFTLRVQLEFNYKRCGETSERQRTAVPVVYAIERSVIMKLKSADEAEVSNFTFLLNVSAGYCHLLLLRGRALWRTLSGGAVNTGHV